MAVLGAWGCVGSASVGAPALGAALAGFLRQTAVTQTGEASLLCYPYKYVVL
jgi:hypothetical protein